MTAAALLLAAALGWLIWWHRNHGPDRPADHSRPGEDCPHCHADLIGNDPHQPWCPKGNA